MEQEIKESSLNPYFIGLPILIGNIVPSAWSLLLHSLNPYFIGLPILILDSISEKFVSFSKGLNPYFIGLPILMCVKSFFKRFKNAVSILILLDYLFL